MKKINIRKKFLVDEYITKEKSIRAISKSYGYSEGAIKRNLLFYGIHVRNLSESKVGNKNPFWKHGKPKCKKCKKILSRYDAVVCIKCRVGKFHGSYKHGKSQIRKYCKICNKNLISYRSKICRKCYHKFLNRGSKHPNWKNGKPKCTKCSKNLFGYRTKLCRKCYLVSLKKRTGSLHPNWKGGKPFCRICKKKQIGYNSKVCKACLQYLFKRENNPNWNGGSSFIPYPLGWTRTYKEQIRYRDRYKCQLCDMPEVESSRKFHVHHIDYNKENLDSKNLLTLCIGCHMKTNYNRKFWKKLFQEKSKYQILYQYDKTQ